jgi:hypothetical protein
VGNEWVSCRGVELAIGNEFVIGAGNELAIGASNKWVSFPGFEITLWVVSYLVAQCSDDKSD